MKLKGIEMPMFAAVIFSFIGAVVSFLIIWVSCESIQLEYVKTPQIYNQFTYSYFCFAVIIFFVLFLLTTRSRIKYLKQLLQRLKSGKIGVLEKGRDEIAANINLMREKVEFERSDKQQIIGGLSHDLRTPLTSIIGYLDLLGNSELNSKQCEYIEIAKQKAKYLSHLQVSLFEYLKISDPDYTLRLELVDLSVFIKQSITEYILQIKDKGISVEMQRMEESIVKADIHILQRIFDNLITNVVKYGESYLRVNICNEGEMTSISIENQTQERIKIPEIFNRFYTGESARNSGASGLGLAIVQAAVQRMRGEVSASLDDGKFTIKIMLRANLQKSS